MRLWRSVADSVNKACLNGPPSTAYPATTTTAARAVAIVLNATRYSVATASAITAAIAPATTAAAATATATVAAVAPIASATVAVAATVPARVSTEAGLRTPTGAASVGRRCPLFLLTLSAAPF